MANDIDIQFELRISALKHLAKHLKDTKSALSQNWEDESIDILNEFSGIEAIAWVNPQLQVVWLSNKPSQFYSKSVYTKLLYKNISLNHEGNIQLSSPIILKSHQKAIFVFIPSSHGFLIALLNLDVILNSEVNNKDYSVSIFENNKLFFHYGISSSTDTGNVSSVTHLNLYGINWDIYLEPSRDLIQAVETHLPFIALILGVFIAILFAITSRLAYLVRQRAQTLDQINQDLTNEIAERRQAEDTKQKLEKALLQGQKLQAIGTLAGGIAHDFNNILYAIIGYVDMAQEDVTKDTVVYKNLGKVLEASKRGQELISRILMFSRRQVYEFKVISLADTINDVLSLLKSTIPASITITFNICTTDSTLILGNQTHLHQVIMNVVNNAVDAMDGEGKIMIQLSKVLAVDPVLKQLPNIAAGNYYKVDISDIGHGMDQDTLERIFEPFFTTKEVGKGTGLGLATAHAIIKEHQGDILVTSQLGQGSTFTLFIPVYSNKES